jgi:tetratricopeptide (TPR) repeat protein
MKSESAEAIELFPLQPAFYFFNGIANYQLESFEDAINSFEAGKEMVLDNKPLKIQFYANLADVYYQLNKFQEAFKTYDAALAEDPNNAYVLNNFSYYLSIQKQDLEKALKMSALSNELLPNNASYLDTYAWIYYQMKDYENAKTQMEKAIKFSKREDPTLMEHYGDILFRLGEKELALNQWKIAIEKGGDSEELKTKVETGTLKDES